MNNRTKLSTLIKNFQSKHNMDADDLSTLFEVAPDTLQQWIDETLDHRPAVAHIWAEAMDNYSNILKELTDWAEEIKLGDDLHIEEVAKLCGYGKGASGNDMYQYWWKDKPHQILNRVLGLYARKCVEVECLDMQLEMLTKCLQQRIAEVETLKVKVKEQQV